MREPIYNEKIRMMNRSMTDYLDEEIKTMLGLGRDDHPQFLRKFNNAHRIELITLLKAVLKDATSVKP